jgi:hypothetical protein
MMDEVKSAYEVADEIVEQWAKAEAGPLDIPAGRLWILKQSIAEAIRSERLKKIKVVPPIDPGPIDRSSVIKPRLL